MKQKKIIDSE